MNKVGQRVDDGDRVELAIYADHQRLPGVLVDDVGQPIGAAVMGAVVDEVIGPDMVRTLRPKPDAGAVVQPQPTPLRLPRRNLQPLPPPDPLHPLGVHPPARLAQQRRDPAIPVATVLTRQLDDVGGQPRLVGAAPRRLALRGAVLAEGAPGPALADAVPDRPNAGDRKGSVVSLGRFPQDQLVKGEIGDRLAKPLVLQLELREPVQLVRLHAAVFPTPAIESHLGDADQVRQGSTNTR